MNTEWTVSTLKEHYDQRFTDIEKATDIASHAMDKRLDGMNEIRQQLNTQAGTMAGKEYVDANNKMIESKIESIQKLVYIGLGGVLVLQVIIGIVIAFWKK